MFDQSGFLSRFAKDVTKALKKLLVNTVAITGSSGFVGRHLVAFLKEKFELVELGRNQSFPFTKFQYMDLAAPRFSQIDLSSVDVLVHCAWIQEAISDAGIQSSCNARASLRLANLAAKAGVKRFIYLSSIKVHGERSPVDRPFKESDEYNPVTDYGKIKSFVEEMLFREALVTQMELVVIRPPLVYGPGAKGNIGFLIKIIDLGLPIFSFKSDNQRSLIGVQNLVDFIGLCIRIDDSPGISSHAFLVSDGSDISTAALINRICKVFNSRSIVVGFPFAALRFIGRILGKEILLDKLFGSLQADISKARSMTGWIPRNSLDEGLSMFLKKFSEK